MNESIINRQADLAARASANAASGADKLVNSQPTRYNRSLAISAHINAAKHARTEMARQYHVRAEQVHKQALKSQE